MAKISTPPPASTPPPPPPAGDVPTAVHKLVSLDTDPNAGQRRPPELPADRPFYLAWHPKRWTVIAGKVVPELAEVRVMPGLNECREGDRGHVNPHPAFAAWQRKGYTVLPHSVGPVVNPTTGKGTYIQAVAVLGGHAHLTVFARAFAGTARIVIDEARYATWLEGLMASGTIARPEIWALQHLRERLADKLAAHQNQAAKTPSYRELVDRLVRDLAVIDAEIEKLSGAAVPVDGAPVSLD